MTVRLRLPFYMTPDYKSKRVVKEPNLEEVEKYSPEWYALMSKRQLRDLPKKYGRKKNA